MTTIPQNDKLLKELTELLKAHRGLFGQERVFQKVALLVWLKSSSLPGIR